MKHALISHGVVYGSDPVAHYSCSSFYLHYWLIIIWYGKASASVSKCNHDTHCFLCPLTSGFLSPQMELSALQSMVAVQEQELQVQAADLESLTRTIQIKEDLIKVIQSFWKTLGNDSSSEYLHLQTALRFIESRCRCLSSGRSAYLSLLVLPCSLWLVSEWLRFHEEAIVTITAY